MTDEGALRHGAAQRPGEPNRNCTACRCLIKADSNKQGALDEKGECIPHLQHNGGLNDWLMQLMGATESYRGHGKSARNSGDPRNG